MTPEDILEDMKSQMTTGSRPRNFAGGLLPTFCNFLIELGHPENGWESWDDFLEKHPIDEQPDCDELGQQEPLRRLPTLYRDEQQLPSGDGLPPPSEPPFPGMEPDLPSKNAEDWEMHGMEQGGTPKRNDE